MASFCLIPLRGGRSHVLHHNNRLTLLLIFQSKGEDTGIDYIETWRGMEQAVELGLAMSIGVSNFNEEQLERLLENCSIKPVVNQFEVNT